MSSLLELLAFSEIDLGRYILEDVSPEIDLGRNIPEDVERLADVVASIQTDATPEIDLGARIQKDVAREIRRLRSDRKTLRADSAIGRGHQRRRWRLLELD